MLKIDDSGRKLVKIVLKCCNYYEYHTNFNLKCLQKIKIKEILYSYIFLGSLNTTYDVQVYLLSNIILST